MGTDFLKKALDESLRQWNDFLEDRKDCTLEDYNNFIYEIYGQMKEDGKALIEEFNNMSVASKKQFADAIKTDEIMQETIHGHLYDDLEARKRIIEKREYVIKQYKNKFGSLNLVEKRCKDYVGVACVDGSCPVANAGEYEERCIPVVKNCKECHCYKGCEDCALAGTEYCTEAR